MRALFLWKLFGFSGKQSVVNCQAYASETQHGCWILTWCMVIHPVWLAFSTELNTQEVAKVGRPSNSWAKHVAIPSQLWTLKDDDALAYIWKGPFHIHIPPIYALNILETELNSCAWSHHITTWVSTLLEMIRPVKTHENWMKLATLNFRNGGLYFSGQ